MGQFTILAIFGDSLYRLVTIISYHIVVRHVVSKGVKIPGHQLYYPNMTVFRTCVLVREVA